MSHNLYLYGKLEYESEKYSSSHRDFQQSLIWKFPYQMSLNLYLCGKLEYESEKYSYHIAINHMGPIIYDDIIYDE